MPLKPSAGISSRAVCWQPVKLMKKDGWYNMKDDVRIVQPKTRMSTAGEMVPKGLKQVLTERGLLDGKLKLDCKDKAFVRSDVTAVHGI